jgi:hypothetical protein
MSIDRRRLLALTGGAAVENATGLVAAALDPRAALAAYATSLFGLIHAARHLGRPGNSAFFVLMAGEVYVQALASADRSPIRVEAASEKSVPAIAKLLSPAKRRRLGDLGFEVPGASSPNYWQDVEIDGPEKLVMAGGLAAAALVEVFDVGEADDVSAMVSIPRVRVLTLRASGYHSTIAS